VPRNLSFRYAALMGWTAPYGIDVPE